MNTKRYFTKTGIELTLIKTQDPIPTTYGPDSTCQTCRELLTNGITSKGCMKHRKPQEFIR